MSKTETPAKHTPEQVFKFLLGEGPLENLWWHDYDLIKTGKYAWRKEVRQVMNSHAELEAEIARLSSHSAELEAEIETHKSIYENWDETLRIWIAVKKMIENKPNFDDLSILYGNDIPQSKRDLMMAGYYDGMERIWQEITALLSPSVDGKTKEI